MRGHNEGSIWRSRTGRFVAAVSVGGGRRITRSCPHRHEGDAKPCAEAKALLRELHAVKALRGRLPAPAPQFALPPAPMGARRATLPKAIGAQIASVAAARGWAVRSQPEARVALVLDRLGLGPGEVSVQTRVGRARLDFAVEDVMVGIEVDGPHHRLPEIAVKDVERDALLAAAGWMVFRVDAYGEDDEIEHRLSRIARFVRSERFAEGRR